MAKLSTTALVTALLAAIPLASLAFAEENRHAGPAPSRSVEEQIATMQAQIDRMQAELDALRSQSVATAAADATPGAPDPDAPIQLTSAPEPDPDGIQLGGAVRFQYSREGFNRGNRQRGGDLDFDIFRLDLHGKVGGIILDAEWRWFEYMSALRHAWVGYDLSDHSQLQLGLTRIPFGNQDFNSHNYFLSSNYHLGLEDTHAMGVEYVYDRAPWNLQLAFFKNDGMGGIDGASSSRNNSYSHNLAGVRQPGEGIYDDPWLPAAAHNTAAVRVAHTFLPADGLSVEVGASGLRGSIRDVDSSLGNYWASALHGNINWGNWNIQAQASRYHYGVDGAERMAVGAYAYYDTIAAGANSYTFNVARHFTVDWGPIQGVDLYNDHSLITGKTGDLPGTYMNVLGMGVSAGDLYTFLDYVVARNQPFIGGSTAGDGGREHRLHVNFGFYF